MTARKPTASAKTRARATRTAAGRHAPTKKHARQTGQSRPGRVDDELWVVLLDLDGTLMHSEAAREGGWQRAITQLQPAISRRCSQEQAFAACKAIYSCHARLSAITSDTPNPFEDMRQEWNTRTFYALLLAWATKWSLPHTLDDSSYIHALEHLLDSDTEREELVRSVLEIRDNRRLEFMYPLDQAQVRFWQGDFCLCPGATELLAGLREHEHMRYYVATEGHLPTQWRKIESLGLGEIASGDPDRRWINEGQLLATSQAAFPQHGLEALSRMIDWQCSLASAFQAVVATTSEASERHRLTAVANSATGKAEGMNRIKKLFNGLSRKATIDPQGLVSPGFFLRVLYAINQDPINPRSRFEKFELSWKDSPRIRLAMVGDNFYSDIKPILRLATGLNSRILSIWITEQSRHGRREAIPDSDVPFKHVEVPTISDAANLLLDHNVWNEQTQPLNRPSGILNSVIEPDRESTDDWMLERNVRELITGIAAVRSASGSHHGGWPAFDPEADKLDHLGQLESPSRDVVRQAERLIEEVFSDIVTDIGLSPRRSAVVGVLLNLSKKGGSRDSHMIRSCRGFPDAAVELLLRIAYADDDSKEAISKYERCLRNVAALISCEDEDELLWARAALRVLKSSPGILEDLKARRSICREFVERLQPLLHLQEFEDAVDLFNHLNSFEPVDPDSPTDDQPP